MKKFVMILSVAGIMTACNSSDEKKEEGMKDKMEEKMDGKMEDKMEEKMDGKMEDKMDSKMMEVKDSMAGKMDKMKPKM